MYFPNDIWLACGGGVGLNDDKCRCLKGRRVVLFPDVGAFDKWSEKAGKMQSYCTVTVSDYLEKSATDNERTNGCDLADYFLRFPFAEIYNFTSTKQTQWGIREDGVYYDRPQIGDRLYHPIARSRWGWASMWFRRSMVFNEIEALRRAPFTLTDAHPIHSAISLLLEQIAPGITFEPNADHSQVLYGNVEGFNNDPILITQKTTF